MSEDPGNLNQAIFDDPPDTLGADESHYGHLFAAMGGMEGVEVARTFAAAGHRLLAEAGKAGETWQAAPPILYCYRHALELYLKALVQPERQNHGLGPLWSALHERIRGRYRADHIAWLGDRIREFHEIDPRSTAFRYHDARPKQVNTELWVDFHNLSRQARRLFGALETIRDRMLMDDPNFGRAA